LASTSAGLAWALGREDGEVSRDEILSHLRVLCESTDLPVNADFEAGFADEPEEVAANVRLAVDTGVAGLSIEDRTGRELYELPFAVERIRASREAIDQTGADVILVGRSEGFLVSRTDIDATIERLAAYADAGADCLYAPGIKDSAHVEAVVGALAPKPVNVLLVSPDMRVPDLAALGVRRVSIGSFLAKAAWAGFNEAAGLLRDQGPCPHHASSEPDDPAPVSIDLSRGHFSRFGSKARSAAGPRSRYRVRMAMELGRQRKGAP
jgi:2-methylisocitrate lyase-like PEP mutase family enzyme